MDFFVYKWTKRDFVVEEVLQPDIPNNTGRMLFLRIEKHNQTTQEIQKQLSILCGVPRHAVGIGGKKDKQAYTYQWFSLPPHGWQRLGGVQDVIAAIHTLDLCHVHRFAWHDKAHHRSLVAGNAFRLHLRKTDILDSEQFRGARTHAWDQIVAHGFPNYFGEQRFGLEQRNIRLGEQMVADARRLAYHERTAGTTGHAKKTKPSVTRRKKRQLGGTYKEEAARKVQSFVSHMFNIVVRKRRAANIYDSVVPGDILMDRQGNTTLYDAKKPLLPSLRQPSAITAPVFGDDMMFAGVGKDVSRIATTRGCHPLAIELATLKSFHLHHDDMSLFGQWGLFGTRRHVRALVTNPSSQFIKTTGNVRVSFQLDSGVYATSLLREIERLMQGYCTKHNIALPTETKE